MEDFNISINMRQLTGVMVSDLRFADGSRKKCVILPVEECGLFTGEKGIYLNLFARRLQEERYGQSHCLRVTWPKEKFNAMYPEQRNALPIVGNMRVAGIQQRNGAQAARKAENNTDAATAEIDGIF